MVRIFLDECGFTGEDFFNPDQPVFTLASLNIPEETCQKLKARHFSFVQANELKHSTLARRPKQQDMIINWA